MKNLFIFVCCVLSFVAKAQNTSLLFNGSTQYLEIPDHNNIDLSANFTIEGWVYPTGVGSQPTEGGIIVNKEASYEIARFADGTFRYALSANGVGTDWSWYNTTLTAPLNTWTHFALVKSGTNVTFYVNAVAGLVNVSNPATMVANTSALRVANRILTNHCFNGYIDELRIWNSAQSLSVVKKNAFNRDLSNAAPELVAYYRMNEGSGSTVVNSCTNTTGINATLINAPSWTNSPVQFAGNALSFDGVDDVVNIANHSSLAFTNAITIEVWCYATKNSGIQSVVSKSNTTTNTGYIFPRTDNGWSSAVAYLFIGGAWRTVTAPYPSLNAWHHLAFTYDGAFMRLYINGTLAATQAQTGSIAVNSNLLALGNQPGFPEQFGGGLDELRIWNVARTASEIQNNRFTELNPAMQTGLVSYFSFNQGIASGNNLGLTNLIDLAGDNNGVLSGYSLAGSGSNYIIQNGGLFTLPVVWTDFAGTKIKNDILLNWSTSSEQNTKMYTVLHSINGQQWSSVGTVSAAGNSSSAMYYQYLHIAPPNGINYYKIQQTDIDNRMGYSKIISVNVAEKNQLISIFPNPVKNGIINITLPKAEVVLIHSMAGELLLTTSLVAGTHQIEIPRFAKGVYRIGAGTENLPLIVQ